ncbi:MAG: hypothetical protein R2809_00815 [Flavobacteriales bacterium]
MSIIAQSEGVLKKDTLLELETQVSGQFLSLRPFHLGLLEETGFAYQYPIDSLSLLFSELKSNADSSIVLVHQTNEKNLDLHILILNELLLSSNSKNTAYKRLCTQNRILRRNADEMIEYVGKLLYQWQDSLMTQGRVLGRMKSELNQTIDIKTQKEAYKTSYHFISEAEAIHKKCQTYLVQVENSQTRFEASNGEAVYYWGVGIQPKPEQASLDQVLGLFLLDMQEFRKLENDFIASIKRN